MTDLHLFLLEDDSDVAFVTLHIQTTAVVRVVERNLNNIDKSAP